MMTYPAVIVRLFAHQMALMDRYRYIEQLPEAPLPLQTKHSQRILKDFAWRTIEEMTEAFQAVHITTVTDEGLRKMAEELGDATHFFIEMCIFAGITPQQCLQRLSGFPHPNAGQYDLAQVFWNFTFNLGVAMNFLRNRPWKQNPKPTDEARFRGALIEVFAELMQVWADLGFTAEDLLAKCTATYEKNQQRLEESV